MLLCTIKNRLICLLACIITLSNLLSCKSIHAVSEIPADTYSVSAKNYFALNSMEKMPSQKRITVEVEETDSVLSLKPLSGKIKPVSIKMSSIENLNLYRYTFDIDILTIPFKIRPSVSGFPEQLNANFSAAVYLGRRRDTYHVRSVGPRNAKKIKVSGVGYGYGGFIGIGTVTMNPFVTTQYIDYEYDGFVLNGGFAGIYDAKKFNLGLAVGADYLVDKNRKHWIYQGKPWFGILFGINLN